MNIGSARWAPSSTGLPLRNHLRSHRMIPVPWKYQTVVVFLHGFWSYETVVVFLSKNKKKQWNKCMVSGHTYQHVFSRIVSSVRNSFRHHPHSKPGRLATCYPRKGELGGRALCWCFAKSESVPLCLMSFWFSLVTTTRGSNFKLRTTPNFSNLHVENPFTDPKWIEFHMRRSQTLVPSTRASDFKKSEAQFFGGLGRPSRALHASGPGRMSLGIRGTMRRELSFRLQIRPKVRWLGWGVFWLGGGGWGGGGVVGWGFLVGGGVGGLGGCWGDQTAFAFGFESLGVLMLPKSASKC